MVVTKEVHLVQKIQEVQALQEKPQKIFKIQEEAIVREAEKKESQKAGK